MPVYYVEEAIAEAMAIMNSASPDAGRLELLLQILPANSRELLELIFSGQVSRG